MHKIFSHCNKHQSPTIFITKLWYYAPVYKLIASSRYKRLFEMALVTNERQRDLLGRGDTPKVQNMLLLSMPYFVEGIHVVPFSCSANVVTNDC